MDWSVRRFPSTSKGTTKGVGALRWALPQMHAKDTNGRALDLRALDCAVQRWRKSGEELRAYVQELLAGEKCFGCSREIEGCAYKKAAFGHQDPLTFRLQQIKSIQEKTRRAGG